MLSWFRRRSSPYETAIAMIGARAGDVVLFIGNSDPDLIAQVALVTGLNGRTIVRDPGAAARTTIDRAAAEAGALVEYEDTPPPASDSICDVVIILAAARAEPVAAALGALKPGGRVLICTTSARGNILGAISGAPADPSGAAAARHSPIDVLQRAGAVAARRLADVRGVAYFEARKPRP